MSQAEKIKHLYWRAGFGMSPNEWKKWKDSSINNAVDFLFRQATKYNYEVQKYRWQEIFSFREMRGMSREEKKEFRQALIGETFTQAVAWTNRMANEERSPLLEKMTLFWHGHFPIRTIFPSQAVRYLNTLRKHGLGNFRDLVLAIARDPAMIQYLNNQQNVKGKPNENFARELLELFTIGRGNYTEQDIKEAARAFTGWSSNPLTGKFRFRKRKHDYGSKTFMGQTGDFDGGDIIDIVLEKKETAHFITKKIYRFFVNERIDEAVINRLANEFYTSNYDIGKLMRRIFTSDFFYEKKNRGNRIKSPVELVAGLKRTLGAKFDDPKATFLIQRALGQKLFNPPNVAGWPGGKAWIDNASLLLRLNIPSILFGVSKYDVKVKSESEMMRMNKQLQRFSAQIELAPLKRNFRSGDLNELSDYLINLPNFQPNRALFAKHIRQNEFKDSVMYLMSLPEYQMC